jgi:VWFA-related protein
MFALIVRSRSKRMFFAAIILAAVRLSAQTSLGSSQASGSEATPQFQIKLPAPLVIEDVVVADSKGQPVHGLKAEDFAVTENGKRMEIRSFEEHSSQLAPRVTADSLLGWAKPIVLPVNMFRNVPQIPASSSLNVLLLDALNTPIGDQLRVRQQMLKFAAGLPPGQHVAIFGLGTDLTMLQGFTTDPEAIRNALTQSRGLPQNSPLRKKESRIGPGGDTLNDAVSDWLLRNKPTLGMDVRRVHQQVEAHAATTLLRQRAISTLQAMNQLARYLSVLPGHKNLVWFSAAFPLNLTPNNLLADPFNEMPDFSEAVRQTADLLARSRVAVYPIDARGIFDDPEAPNTMHPVNRYLEVHEGAIANEKSLALASDEVYAERDTMEQVAAATGGIAFFNTNGFKEAVDKVLEYGENYYTITYTPPAQKFDGKYRKVQVFSEHPELRVYYRAGYFADDPIAPASGKSVLPLNPMQTAMLHGAPDAIRIHFDARVTPAVKPSDQLTPGGRPDAKWMKPPYMSYRVEFFIDIRTVQFTVDADKVHHGSLEVASYIYDPDGNPVNSTLSRVNLDLPDDRFTQIAQQGVLTRQTVEAPAKGEYYLRVGLHDLKSDNVGALEVPLATLKSPQEMHDDAAAQPAQ